MVEQRTENPCVGSSILPSTTGTRSDRAGFLFPSHFPSHFFRSRYYFRVPSNALFDTIAEKQKSQFFEPRKLGPKLGPYKITHF